jgi:hypothetical protein
VGDEARVVVVGRVPLLEKVECSLELYSCSSDDDDDVDGRCGGGREEEE